MDIEVRIIEELQKCLDEVKRCDDEIKRCKFGDTLSKDAWANDRRYWSDKYITWSAFAERVTGKKIESGGWNVRFAESNCPKED